MPKPNIPAAQKRAEELLKTPLKDFCGEESAIFLCTAPYMATRQLSETDLAEYAKDPFEFTPGGSKHRSLRPVTLEPDTATVADGLMQLFRRDEEEVFANAAQIKAFARTYPDAYQQIMDENKDKKKFAGLITAIDTLAKKEPLTDPKQLLEGLAMMQGSLSLMSNMSVDLDHKNTSHTQQSTQWLQVSQLYPRFLTPMIRELIAIKKDLGLGRSGRSRGGDKPKED